MDYLYIFLSDVFIIHWMKKRNYEGLICEETHLKIRRCLKLIFVNLKVFSYRFTEMELLRIKWSYRARNWAIVHEMELSCVNGAIAH